MGSKTYVQRCKEQHRCPECGEKLPDGYTKLHCEKCLAYRNKKRELLKKEHICVACCKAKAEPGKTLCKNCLERMCKISKEYYKKRITYRREHGLCTKCGKPISGPYKTCDKCRKYQREKKREELKRKHDEEIRQNLGCA